MSKIKGILETPEFIFKAQTNFIRVDRVEDAAHGGVFYTTATTFMEILNQDGTHVANSTSSLTFQTGSAGRWEGTFDESVDITVGNPYLINVTITSGGDVGLWRKELRGRYRDE